MHQVGGFMISGTGIQAVQSVFLMLLVFVAMFAGLPRRVKVPFDVAKDEGLPNGDDIVVAQTWWFNILASPHSWSSNGLCQTCLTRLS